MTKLTGRGLIIVGMVVSVLFFSSINTDSSIEIIDTINSGFETLTIADLDWQACDTERGLTLPFNPQSSGGYSFDQTSNSLHVIETTGTNLLYAGVYTNFSIPNGAFSISFEGKAKAGHMDAVNLIMAIYDNDTKIVQKVAEPITLEEGCHYRTALETPYISYNGTFILDSVTDVILFFFYYDAWSADWDQEFWIQDLIINTDTDGSSLLSENITKIHTSTRPRPTGLIWKDGHLFYGTKGSGTIIVEVDPTTGLEINSFGVDLDHGFTFDGVYFWTSHSHQNIDYIHKYDSSFNSQGTLGLPFGYISGITFDGTNLWVSNHITDTIYKINPTTGDVISSIPSPGTRSREMQYFDDHIWITDSDTHQFYKISTTDGAIIETYDSEIEYPFGITIDDEGYIWLTSLFSCLIYKTNVNALPVVVEMEKISFIWITLGALVVLPIISRKKERNSKIN